MIFILLPPDGLAQIECSIYALLVRARLYFRVEMISWIVKSLKAVWYLLSDFNHLYPGPGPTTTSTGTEGHTIRVPPPPSVAAVAPSPQKVTQKSNNEKTNSDDAVSCSSHPACSGLIGDCCPTSTGVLLECCS